MSCASNWAPLSRRSPVPSGGAALKAELAQNPGVRARFLREGFVANAVGHSGVVRIHHRDEDPGGAVFLIMELALWEAAITLRARSIATLMPWLPGAAAFVIDEALRFEREQRWPDARTMQGALRDARPLLEQSLSSPISALDPVSGLSASADQPTIPASRRAPVRSCG